MEANEKIYVIIDEYDHFANELLGFQTELFKNMVSRNGKVRKWYEVLKKGTESVVDRIFITGVTPITLDSMTSGFNISSDITRDGRFNEMLGFTRIELEQMMQDIEISKEEQEMLLPILKANYDGYKFSIDAVLIEFKYLKKAEADNLEKVKEEARNQVKEYSELEQIKLIPNLHKYIVVAVVDEIYVEEC